MQMRRLLPIVFLAACGPKPGGTGPSNHGGAPGDALSVEVGGATEEWSATLQPANGSHFPALSVDGTTIVDLVHDEEDFSGRPITTLVFYTKAGKVDSYRYESSSPDEPDVMESSGARVVESANAKLAATTWHPLPLVEATGEDAETGAPNTLDFGDGVTVKLADVVDRFPPPGQLPAEMAAETGGGGCGEYLGLTTGYGSREAGFVVVYGRANLGGDDCMGELSADTGLVVPVP